jgi:hypothetical protein
VQRKLEEAQAFMETVNNSKLGQDWREKTAASEPGQLGRFVGEGMMIGTCFLLFTEDPLEIECLHHACVCPCFHATIVSGVGSKQMMKG